MIRPELYRHPGDAANREKSVAGGEGSRCGDRDCYEFRAAPRNAARSRGANHPQRRTAARLADPMLRGRDACETSTSVSPLLPRHSVEVRNVCRRLLRQTSGHAHQGDHQNARAPASNECHDQPPNRNHSCPHFPWSRKLPGFLAPLWLRGLNLTLSPTAASIVLAVRRATTILP